MFFADVLWLWHAKRRHGSGSSFENLAKARHRMSATSAPAAAA
eukprot:CAMPEP_0203938426 /NCGR_PEP_ID=MMETSP0359-20131031/75456_1 /ASSEMBLY_ACC=CAM_ASM_000338 /TAXON_ID=268821 /ORGANISM="Scrippsiella Hangoei, Strain SHTV-5" /LENGTH=42 /DNA_ID= /DNA_START= /DNA_END= /DNA_ORIENTATION=